MIEQPLPTPGGQAVTPIARDLFHRMLTQRAVKGLETYGQALQAHNGRDAVQDAMEECLDLWQYLVQIKLERDGAIAATVNATQPADLMPAWEAFNTSLAALIESATGEYVEQRRFTAFEAGWNAGGMASVDATLRDALVEQASRRIKQLTEERDTALKREANAIERMRRAETNANDDHADWLALDAKLAASEQRAAAAEAENAAVRYEVGGEADESLLDAVMFWLAEHEHYSKMTQKYGEAIREALEDYDRHDELSCIDRLRVAIRPPTADEIRAQMAAAAPSAGAEGA